MREINRQLRKDYLSEFKRHKTKFRDIQKSRTAKLWLIKIIKEYHNGNRRRNNIRV